MTMKQVDRVDVIIDGVRSESTKSAEPAEKASEA